MAPLRSFIQPDPDPDGSCPHSVVADTTTWRQEMIWRTLTGCCRRCGARVVRDADTPDSEWLPAPDPAPYWLTAPVEGVLPWRWASEG